MPDMRPPAPGTPDTIGKRLSGILAGVYRPNDLDAWLQQQLSQPSPACGNGNNPGPCRWDESTSILMSYADTVTAAGRPSLDVLKDFLDRVYAGNAFTVLHVLPFLQSSSDGGFAVSSHTQLEQRFGHWGHLQQLARGRRLMADLILNHVSASHPWVQQFRSGQRPGTAMVMAPADLDGWENVVRPRSSALFTIIETCQGLRPVWTTFGPDQVDLDWRDIGVFEAFAALLNRYVDHGITWIRLDAVGFLWKQRHTSCIHLPQTRALVRAFRLLLEQEDCSGVLITETNVPEEENLSYVRSGDQAHMAYNFPLPPLLLEAMLSSSSDLLNRWLARWPTLPPGSTLLNFSASHDGIGLRPAETLISPERLVQLLVRCEERGGLVSHHVEADGSRSPYEINITWWGAMASATAAPQQLQLERFLASQLFVMALPGVPAFYLPALLASANDRAAYRRSGQRRDVNRQRFRLDALERRLSHPHSAQTLIRVVINRALALRATQPAFHPEAPMTLLSPGQSDMVILRRDARSCSQRSVWVVHSFREERLNLPLARLGRGGANGWVDLLSNRAVGSGNLALTPYEVLWLQPAG